MNISVLGDSVLGTSVFPRVFVCCAFYSMKMANGAYYHCGESLTPVNMTPCLILGFASM